MSAIEDNQTRPIQSEVDGGADPLLAEFQRLKQDILDAERARNPWRKYAQECYDFVAGHQWSQEDEALLASQNRPVVSFNRVAPLVKAVCGLEVNNRQGVVYLPRQVGQSGFNEMITATGKWIRDECAAEDEESEAFRDLCISGEGWTETRMDYDEDPMGKIVKERIDPLEMGVNKGAFRANYADARLVYRVRDMDPDDVRALLNLPDSIADDALDAKWLDKGKKPADGGQGNKRDYPDKTRSGVAGRNAGPRRTVTVVQAQYWKRETVHLVATAQDDEPQQLSPDDWQKFQDRAKQMEDAAAQDPTGEIQPLEFTHAQTVKKQFYQCFIGVRILEMSPMKMGMFQFSAMTGERDKKEKYFTGMVGDTIDPQRWANKFFAQTMNILNTNAKGGLIAETDAFVNQKTAQKNWADPTKIIWVKPGSLSKQKIKERQAFQLPTGLDQMMMFAISSIRDVTGINLELLGQADREQAASLEQQRRQSAMTILATMFDNLRKYRKRDGKLLLHFIWLLPDGTLARVVEQGQFKYIPLIKQGLDLEKFDIIIDQAPSSPDQKQYIWSITAQILQMNILPPPAIIELLKYSPYPESVVQEIRGALGLDGPTADQLQQKLQQAEQALQVLEGQLREAQQAAQDASTAADKAKFSEDVQILKLKIDEYKAITERLGMEWQGKIDAASAIVDAAQADAQAVGGEAPGLPDIDQMLGGDTQGPAEQGPSLDDKVNHLTDMVGQLVQALGNQQQQQAAPVPQSSAAPPPEADQGEM